MDRFRRRSSASAALAASTESHLGRAISGALRRISPSRKTRINIEGDSDPVRDDKGPLGLNLLHAVPEPLIDFIFVHGLGGGSRKTWSISPDPQHYWPKEWLPQDPDFRCVRIHSFGYKADWDHRRESILSIHDFARSLLEEVHCSPAIRRSKTKIVFIAHSMGGIVIKKAYMLAREDPGLRDLAHRIHTLYFLATPHRGSDLAKTLSNILQVSHGPKPFLRELDRTSETITSINDSFRHVSEALQLWSFYETIQSNLVLAKALIVDKSSATLGYANERSLLLNADHRGVCKFDLPTDPNYQTLRKSFITTIDSILSEVSQATSKAGKLQLQQLVKLTGVAEPPIEELSALEDVRVPGTGKWLASSEAYASWRTEQTAKRRIFCLTANPGSGKSVLSGQLIHDLQERELRCSYYFFQHGNAMKSTIAGCLRALAYQMASSDNAILRRACEVQQEAASWEQWDEKTIWRKLFVGCIFKEPSSILQFWVIDALDECQRFPVFLSLIAEIPQHLKIFITSRRTPELENGLIKFGQLAEHYRIKAADTLNDLSIFIESKMDLLPASDENGREHLKQRILAKASGSFLWVSLVVKELEQAYSEEYAEEILNELPTDMNKFYARMLESVIGKNPRSATLARTVFMWTLLSLRPLNVDELQFAIKLDINQTVHNLGKSISTLCSQLVCVNLNNEVETIHQTAKAFLLQQDDYPDLALDKLQSHTRIAQVCLKILTGDVLKGFQPRPANTSSFNVTPGTGFIDYACEYFSDHLQKCSAEDSTTWELLFKFLNGNLLSWIEYLARKGKLRHITHTAKNLQAYLRRRVKHPPPFSPDKEGLETWVYDLIRLNAKFGASLDISPSSIYNLIPAMCPSDSCISKTRKLRQPRLRIKGQVDKTWDDCLVRIDYPAHQTSAVAHGDQYAAVAVFDGTIFLYYQDSAQAKSSLGHGERAKILAFSTEDKYLVSSGLRKVKVWNPAEGTQVWSLDTDHQTLTLLFVHNNTSLAAATQGGYTLTWDLEDGTETEQWQWTDSIYSTASVQKPRQQPGKALFSPNYTVLVVSYRGLPLYIFNIRTKKFIGCCSREASNPSRSLASPTNHYVVDALAFNPSSEFDNLVVSYGDGELAVYDVQSTELHSRSSDVYAHNLACSPDGRTIVTGSSRGTIQIFEFAGARGENLSLVYRINAYEDGIRGIAFSSDSLRFADIRGSQYRIWEPAVLVCNNMDDGSQSELSQAIPLEPRSVSMLEGPPEAEVTAMCCHPDGDFVFCGKEDGSVAYFETNAAAQGGILYRHAARIGITCIAYVEKKSLLITADESGRVLINNIRVSQAECEMVAQVAEIRSEESLAALLGEPSGSKILIQGSTSAQVWTTKGEKVGLPIQREDNDERTTTNHPLHAEYFISIGRKKIRIYSWANSLEAEPSFDGEIRALSLTVTPPSPALPRSFAPEDWPDANKHHQTSQFVTHLLKNSTASTSCSDCASLQVWPASNISTFDPFPRPISIPGFDSHSNKVQKIIGTAGSLILFLDKDLWVCSIDVARISSNDHGAKRHFFLLSEWQSGDRGFIIEYISSRREFVVARKHGILVVSRGLEFEEPWFSL